eukprot:3449080-Pyramimonas_sp.AAC.1
MQTNHRRAEIVRGGAQLSEKEPIAEGQESTVPKAREPSTGVKRVKETWSGSDAGPQYQQALTRTCSPRPEWGPLHKAPGNRCASRCRYASS